MTANHESPSTRPDGRSEHKPRTRQALIDAALSLFAAKGYEAATTDEIAEWAGVSTRTFFRYFESKEHVLFFGGDAFNRAVIRSLPDQPSELDDLAALAATQRSLAPIVEPLKPRIRLYFRALEGSSALMGRHTRDFKKHNLAVAEALAARRSLPRADERCQIAATLSGVAMDRAYQAWLRSKRDLAELITESFALVRAVAAEPSLSERS
ncbi:MAG TPA: TetR family transcriptional regulator [Amycolatopsis sp.]|nr:TetR family transcriptional regulator [Amycolatopsis sp.]